MTKAEPLLWLSDDRGIYIPRDFANSFVDRAKNVTGVSDENWAILESGPDNEQYWDAWTEVCDNAKVTDNNGDVFAVYQDGDCWLVPEGMEWSEETDFFRWPSDDDDTDESPDYRGALSEANSAMFDAIATLQSGDIQTALKLLEPAHAKSGELLIGSEA